MSKALCIFTCLMLACFGALFLTGAGVNSISRLEDYRAGNVALTALETTKAVTFSAPMSDTNYVIQLSGGGVATTLTWGGRATSGFVINLSVGITGLVSWLVIAQK